jgi:hypothetical protein
MYHLWLRFCLPPPSNTPVEYFSVPENFFCRCWFKHIIGFLGCLSKFSQNMMHAHCSIISALSEYVDHCEEVYTGQCSAQCWFMTGFQHHLRFCCCCSVKPFWNYVIWCASSKTWQSDLLNLSISCLVIIRIKYISLISLHRFKNVKFLTWSSLRYSLGPAGGTTLKRMYSSSTEQSFSISIIK